MLMAAPLLSDPARQTMGRPANPCLAAMYAAAMLFAALEGRAAEEPRSPSKLPQSPQQAKPFIARQQIDAEVVKVDQSGNTLTLKTNAGKLRVQATLAVPAYFKKGDGVLLEVGILSSPHTDPPAQRRAAREGTDPGIVRQYLDAEVARADLKTGVLTLKSVAGTVKIELPSTMITAFRRGEVLPVELMVGPVPPVQASPPTEADGPRRAGLAALLFAIFGKSKK
jgi:hypothetical protein